MQEDHESLFEEVSDFIAVERPMKKLGSTCYFSCVIQMLNVTRRLVLTFLMREPHPYPPESFCSCLKDFMYEYRKMDFKPKSYEDLLEVMEEHY